ncbi:MAG TPA: tetraacyldisaccharide 4'-kinase [Chitinophagaceae bacterium]|nr:tetraacyldisaccharide 4'-kinase [Chitinophagaceae bacterium]
MKRFILNLLRYLLLPFSVLYGIIVAIRNKMYDSGVLTSVSFSVPVICVGNLTAGGTGKSPMIEYLIVLLRNQYHLATLSRGYKRYTRGFRLADAGSDARIIGDEPFQFKRKFPEVEVCVAEERMTAIPLLLQQRPYTEVILLDDAFQHRSVKAGLNILITDYHRLYTRDQILPFGLLRESKSAADRADLIIVTKCPDHIDKDAVVRELAPREHQSVFFSRICYEKKYPVFPGSFHANHPEYVLMICGIAHPEPLQKQLETEYTMVYPLIYKDHHYFSIDDLDEIQDAFDAIDSENKIMICTEKDAGRLMVYQEEIIRRGWPLFVQPIRMEFLFQEDPAFNNKITNFIKSILPDPELEIVEEDHNLSAGTIPDA